MVIPAWSSADRASLVLLLVHLVGMTCLANLQRWSLRRAAATPGDVDRSASDEPPTEAETEALRTVHRRFFLYRTFVRLASLSAAIGLAVWLGWPRP
jgi:hypothetical protein